MSGYLFLWLMFAKIGLFSFGGGYAMLPLIFQTVEEAGFMTVEQFSDLVALSQVTPGPVAVNAATYVGFNYAGLLGAAAATIGVAIPSFVIVLIVSAFLKKSHENRIVNGIFTGIRPVTVGLIASAVIVLAQTVIVTAGTFNLIPFLIFIAAFVLAWKFKMSPIKITLLMAVIGAFIC